MLTPGALHRLAIVMSPVSRAFKLRSLTRACCPTNSNLKQHSLGRMERVQALRLYHGTRAAEISQM